MSVTRVSQVASPTIAIDGMITWGYLPHRFPFMLLDRVQLFDPVARRLIGVKSVSQNEPFLQGHFPEHPIFPGVMLIEALAQASGMLFNLEYALEHGSNLDEIANGRFGIALPRNVILAESRIKHTKPVYPGSQVLLETQAVLSRGDLSSFKVAATVDGEEVSKGQLTLARLSSMQEMEFKS